MAMTPRERFLAALARQPVDRVPVANPTSIVTRGLQEKAGVFFPEANYEAEPMAELALAGHTICGYDAVSPAFGAGTHESAALGVATRWGDRDSLPAQEKAIWSHPDEIEIPDDFLERPSVKSVVEAIRLLKEEVGDRVAVIGKVFGPWSLAYHTIGLQKFLIQTMKDPGFVHAVLERLKPIPKMYAQAQIEAGADALTYACHITADLIRPSAVPDYVLPIHQEMAAEIDCPLILHCCGRTIDRIEHFNKNGMAAFHFESANDAKEMRDQAEMVLIGNINNTNTLVGGEPEDVRREVHYAIEAGVDMIAPECAVPVTAKLENVIAVRDSVDAYYEAVE